MESTDLFVGIPITAAIQQSLDGASLPFRRYFEGGKFLQVVDVDGKSWLGKAITRGASSDRLEDMKRHVESVILKIDPETVFSSVGIEVRDLPPPVEEPVEEVAAESSTIAPSESQQE